MSRPRVVVVYPLPSPEQELRLAQEVEVVRPAHDGPEAVAEALRDADGIILRGPARLTEEMIGESPRLRVIAAQGSGTENIAVEAATAAGIPVVHGAGVAPKAVAEYVIGAMVLGHRRFPTMHRLVVEGPLEWEQRMWSYRGFQLSGSTLGIVGFGHIGREVARMARAAFDVDICVFDPYIDDKLLGGARRLPLDAVFARSDTVTIHVPLTPATRGLVADVELELLGGQGVLVNTSRGGVVDEDALVRALTTGTIRAAVLDVFDPEPPEPAHGEALGRVPGLLVTPHIAGVTTTALDALCANVVDSVLAVLHGRPATGLVNPVVQRLG